MEKVASTGRDLARLGQRLRLQTVCTRLTVLDETVEVETTTGSIIASTAIVALPSAVLPSVEFVGVPPSLREVLASLPQTGDVLKVVAEFDRASWKESGLNGESVSDLCATYASSPRALTLYAGGDAAPRFRPRNGSHVEPSLAHLFRVFDATPKAPPLLFDWASEPFSCGGYTAFAPGGMSAWEGLRALHGRVVLAGEYTDTFWGYMEGAIRSGERAAKQILDAGL